MLVAETKPALTGHCLVKKQLKDDVMRRGAEKNAAHERVSPAWRAPQFGHDYALGMSDQLYVLP